MKRLFLMLPVAIVAATPAHATSGLVCRTAGPQPIDVLMVVGHSAVARVVSARLTDNGRGVAVQVAQSWIDPAEVRIDLTDPSAVRHELRLRVRRNGNSYDGSIWRGGKRRWIRCREG